MRFKPLFVFLLPTKRTKQSHIYNLSYSTVRASRRKQQRSVVKGRSGVWGHSIVK